MELFADLHTHSDRSDGQDPVPELIDHAAGVPGLCAIALCDHDTLPPETIRVNNEELSPADYAARKGLLFLPGIEVSCDTLVDDVHVVGLFCDFSDPGLTRIEEDVKRSKQKGYEALCNRLCDLGYEMAYEDVLRSSGRTPDTLQRKQIFEMMAKRGCAPDWQQAKLMVRNDPALNVRREKPDPIDVIGRIHRAGGIAILAHPFLIDEKLPETVMAKTREDYIELLIAAGLDGMEADYPYDKTSYAGTASRWEIAGQVQHDYAPRLSFISGGSDYHADHKTGVKNARKLGDGRVAMRYYETMIAPLADRYRH